MSINSLIDFSKDKCKFEVEEETEVVSHNLSAEIVIGSESESLMDKQIIRYKHETSIHEWDHSGENYWHYFQLYIRPQVT